MNVIARRYGPSLTQSVTPADFVRAVMLKIGATGPTDLAKKAKLDPWDAPKRVSRWLKARTGQTSKRLLNC